MKSAVQKTGRGAHALEYLLFRDELRLDEVGYGIWYDPMGIFERFAVQHQGGVSGNAGTYFALACGLNPHLAAGAFRSSGGVNPRRFVELIWSEATRDERKKIAEGRINKQYRLHLTPSSSPGEVGDIFWELWNDRSIEKQMLRLNQGADRNHPEIQRILETPVNREAIKTDLVWAARQVGSAGCYSRRFLLTDKASLNRNTGHSLGYTAPRDVSLLTVLASPDDRTKILDVFDRSVEVALRYVQEHAGWTRVRHNGKVWTVPCHYAAVRYRHYLPHPVKVSDPASKNSVTSEVIIEGQQDLIIDPHLHMHVHLLNLVRDAAGQYRSLEADHIVHASLGSQAAFGNEFAYLLRTELGLDIEKTGDAGDFRVKDIGLSVVAAFSHRSDKIKAALGERSSPKIAEYERRRQRKPKLNAVPQALFAHWRQRGARVGFGMPQARNLMRLGRKRLRQIVPGPIPDIDEMIGAVSGHLSNKFAFGAEKLRSTVLRHYVGDFDTQSLLGQCALAQTRLVNVGRIRMREHFVTLSQVRKENELLSLATKRLPGGGLAGTLDTGHALSPEQQAQVVALVEDVRHLRICDLPANPERDAIQAGVAAVLSRQGYRIQKLEIVRNVAPHKESGLLAALRQHRRGDLPDAFLVEGAERLRGDEYYQLMRLGTEGRNIVILLADRQHPDAVLYASLLDRMITKRQSPGQPVPSATPSGRFVQWIREGNAVHALVELEEHKLLRLFNTPGELYEAVADDFVRDRQSHPGKTQQVLTVKASTAAKLETLIEQKLQEAGLAAGSVPASNKQGKRSRIRTASNAVDIRQAVHRTYDRVYIVQEGMDRVNQIYALTRHREQMTHYVDRETVKDWLRQFVDATEKELYDKAQLTDQHVGETLIYQWENRQYKVSALDCAEEMASVAKISWLNAFAYKFGVSQCIRANEILTSRDALKRRAAQDVRNAAQGACALTEEQIHIGTVAGSVVASWPKERTRPSPLPRRISPEQLVSGLKRIRQLSGALLQRVAQYDHIDAELTALLDSVELEDLHLPWALTESYELEKLYDKDYRRTKRYFIPRAVRASSGSEPESRSESRPENRPRTGAGGVLQDSVLALRAGDVVRRPHDGGSDVDGAAGP